MITHPQLGGPLRDPHNQWINQYLNAEVIIRAGGWQPFPEEDQMTARAAELPEATTETPTIPKVKVKVSQNASGAGGVVITSTHPPGSVENIAQFFNSSKLARRVITSGGAGYNLRQTIQRIGTRIPADVWAQAIAAEIISRLGSGNVGEVEMNTVGAGGYLALDNGVYRLVPVECAPINKAMSVIRRRMIDKAGVECNRMVNTAKNQAAAITDQAGLIMQAARVKEAELRQQGDSAPPQWVISNHEPIRMKNGVWHIGFSMKLQLLKFEYSFYPDPDRSTITRKAWPAAPHTPYRFLLWVPLQDHATGQYNNRAIYVDPSFLPIPHVNYESSCMALSDAPTRIQNAGHLAMLVNSFNRCMRTVNLASVLSWASQWDPQLQAAIPPAIRPLVLVSTNNDIAELRAPGIVAPEQSTTATATEGLETWTAQIA
jgi:hypothetical protein